MHLDDFVSPVQFTLFRDGQMASFRNDIEKYADRMLATRSDWLATVPTFEDFRELLPSIVERHSNHTALHRPDTIRELMKALSRNVELTLRVYSVWVSCAYHVHDAIVRDNRLPSKTEITAWTFEYGQQLNLAYKRDRLSKPPRSKHRGGKVQRIPTRKAKKRR